MNNFQKILKQMEKLPIKDQKWILSKLPSSSVTTLNRLLNKVSFFSLTDNPLLIAIILEQSTEEFRNLVLHQFHSSQPQEVHNSTGTIQNYLEQIVPNIKMATKKALIQEWRMKHG
jgi:hypothetical protein